MSWVSHGGGRRRCKQLSGWEILLKNFLSASIWRCLSDSSFRYPRAVMYGKSKRVQNYANSTFLQGLEFITLSMCGWCHTTEPYSNTKCCSSHCIISKHVRKSLAKMGKIMANFPKTAKIMAISQFHPRMYYAQWHTHTTISRFNLVSLVQDQLWNLYKRNHGFCVQKSNKSCNGRLQSSNLWYSLVFTAVYWQFTSI